MSANQLRFISDGDGTNWSWKVPPSSVVYDPSAIKEKLRVLETPCFIVNNNGQIGVSHEAYLDGEPGDLAVAAFAPAFSSDALGDPEFKKTYGVKYTYHGGAMANAIASAELVIAMGKAGILCSYGAGGCVATVVEQALQKIQRELPNGPYAVNLIHSPNEPALEQGNVNLFLKYGVKVVEASAFLGLTPQVVQYRAAGLSQGPNGQVIIDNKVIAKISRTETAQRFMEPAPLKILNGLVEKGLITALQAELAQKVPLADDITVEADSGGHTDNRPLVALLPAILALRDEIQEKYQFDPPLRVGVGGGIGTPNAALAAYAMGAAFVVTGSINQPCIESGSSDQVREMLVKAEMADVIMAPAADMFEMGVKLQVLKRGTLFAMRAQKLYDIYLEYNSIDEIPSDEREKLEKQVFRQPLEDIWAGTIKFFEERDPALIAKAKDNPKRKMALIFRWYLGLSSRWANTGEKGREMDYQIWAGPSLGAFNAWVKGTYLEPFKNRRGADVAYHIMEGAAYLQRIHTLRMQGLAIPPVIANYVPAEL